MWKGVWKHVQNAQSIQIHPLHVQSLIQALWYVQCPMILLMDSEGPDQTAQMVQSDLGLHCPHLPKDRFRHCMARMDLLTFITLLADLVGDKLMIFFIFFP